MWNAKMKLDDGLTEGIPIVWKVTSDISLFYSTMLSFANDRLRLRYYLFSKSGLIRKHGPFKRCGPDHFVLLAQAPIAFLLVRLKALEKLSRSF